MEFKELQVDFDSLEKQISVLGDKKILFAELGVRNRLHNNTDRLDLLEILVESLRDSYGHNVLLGVHHAGTTILKLENPEIKFDGYVTLINRLSVMMFPTRDIAVEAIWAARKLVIAIKPLAGGRIKPKEALEHVYNEMGIDFCMIGVGSEREAAEDFVAA
jgi:hypothetical protein